MRQLATRPESTPSVAEKKYCAEPERRSQYISANAGKTFHMAKAAAITHAARMGAALRSRMRRRLSQASIARATRTLISDPRE